MISSNGVVWCLLYCGVSAALCRVCSQWRTLQCCTILLTDYSSAQLVYSASVAIGLNNHDSQEYLTSLAVN